MVKVVGAAVWERKLVSPIPKIGDTRGPYKKAVFACFATDDKIPLPFTSHKNNKMIADGSEVTWFSG